MSTTIDERVVEMRFDNKQFENNVQTSLSSLAKLKQSLNMSGASKGLENVNAAAKNVSFSGLNSAIETVGIKFNAMYTIADTVLRNITNAAYRAGENIVSSLSIDPVKMGFDEYETKINAIQTIMSNTASKGTTMDDVTRVLGDLNTYADKTIYNFAEMTRNIGTFTAAGVGLEDSAKAIQGIANLAAASGSTSHQASTAMYQLSQALAAGTVKLMDWNSVVNAGMGGEKFQEALKATAREYGVAVDDIIKSSGSFRESLQEGWITADILNETLSKFTVDGAKKYAQSMIESGKYTQEQADALIKEAQAMEDAATKVKTYTQLWDTLKESAQSGWSQSWEIIVGDFEEAKVLFTEVSDVIGAMIGESANARNEVLQGWKDVGGRAAVIESFRNSFEGIMSVVKPVKEAFREIFPSVTVKQLLQFSRNLERLTENFKISETTADNLKRTFKGVFALFDIGIKGITAFAKAVGSVINYIAPAGNGILAFTADIGDFLVALNESVEKTDVFNKAFQKLGNVVRPIADSIVVGLKTLVEAVKSFFTLDFKPLDDISQNVQTRLEPLGAMGTFVAKGFEVIVSALKKALPALSNLASSIGNVFGDIMDAITNADFSTAWDIVNGGILAGIGVAVKRFLDSLTNATGGVDDILSGIVGVLDGVKGSLEAWQASIKAGTLLKIASAVAILAAALVALSLLDSAKLTGALAAISVLFVELSASMKAFQKIASVDGFGSINKMTVAMIGMSTAILILSSSVAKLANLEWNDLIKGLVGVAGLSATLVISAKQLSTSSNQLIKGSTGLVVFATAIKILVESVEALSIIDSVSLLKGLMGVGILCMELSLFLNSTDLNRLSLGKGIGLITLAAGIRVLAESVEAFANLNIKQLAKGLGSVGVVLLEISLFMKSTGNAKNVISTAVSMTILGGAMLILAEAVGRMGELSLREIGKGLLTMAGSLTAITLAVKKMPNDMVSKAAGLVGISAAMVILSKALITMGSMNGWEIAKSMTTLAVSMLILTTALNAMKTALPGAAAMLTVATSLAILAPVLKSLGSMSLGEIVKGLFALAGVFGVLGGAAVLLGKMVPTILALSASISLFGIGCLAVGAGVLAFSAGLAALAVSGTAAAAAIVAIVTGIVSLIPMILEQLGYGIVAFATAIANGAPALAEAFTVLVTSLVQALVASVPELTTGLLELLIGVFDGLVVYAPQLVESLFDLLIGVIDSLSAKIPQLIQAAANLLGSFLQGIFDAMGGYEPENLIKMITATSTLIGCFALLAASASLALKAVAATVAMGLVMAGITAIFVALTSLDVVKVQAISDSLSTLLLSLSASMLIISLVPIAGAMTGIAGLAIVVAGIAAILAALGGLAQIPGFSWLMGEGTKVLGQIGNAIGSFVGSIASGFMTGISSGFPQIGTDLAAFMTNVQPFLDGIRTIDASSTEGVKALAEMVLILTAANLLKGITSWFTGGSSIVDFGKEIAEFAPYFRQYYESIKGIDGKVVESSANAAKALAEFANNIPNQGGLLAKLAGENSLSVFADELMVFGPKLKAYADSVKGLDADVVVNSANAAMAMAEMAENLPNSGGVAGWFMGENNLSLFAEELSQFGPKLKAYADSVKGLDAGVVINSTNAAKALSELASNLPNTGGAVAWFTGDNDMATFGSSLVSFGQSFSLYSSYMKNVDTGIVTATTSAASSIVSLQNSLPKEGGWFSDDMSLSTFGSDIASFGYHFSSYYGYVSGINTSQLSKVIDETNSLVAMAKGMVGLDVSAMSSFGQSLSTLGQNGVTGFINAFTNANSQVTSAASTMITSFVKGANSQRTQLISTFNNLLSAVLTTMRNKYASFTTEGRNLMVKFIAGIKEKDSTVKSTITTILSSSLTAMKNKYSEFTNVGKECMSAFISGVSSKSNEVCSAFTGGMGDAVGELESYHDDFYGAGSYVADGFVSGISDNIDDAARAAAEMASAAVDAANKELDINSPSKVFYGVGNYSGMGFVNALVNYASKAYNAGSNMAESAISGLSYSIAKIADVVNGNIDVQPTIRPVLDLSDVESKSGRLNALFSRTQAMSISTGVNRSAVEATQNGIVSASGGNTFQFTQNNYSPKALSRIEIYRQTRNQFTAMKEVLS